MPRIRTAHKFSERQRTHDVLTDELVDFKSLLLSPDVLKGLNSSGFERPSPIQLKAIPLGRCGLDLIAQAKSGTGKTCVFSVIALESVLLDNNATQVLILAPTREIAVQIKEVITAIGSQMNNLVCHVFIGGLPVEDNKKILKKPCHIAVGTPGRIKFLIENHFLKTESVRLFILDEADKLLEDNFQEQINWIFSSLPSNKQMMAFSATYPEYLAKHLTRYMREPTFVRLNATDPTLQGIKQFHKLVPFHPLPHKTFQEKVSELLKVLSSLPFHQCLVFSNYQIRAQSLCDTLRLKGWPSVFIAGSQTQSQRLKAMEKLKEFKCRVLISTDLTSRGIDAEHVNLVVNMDVPRDSETYLHRIGRAGRFGTQGIAVTFVAQGEEDKLFKRMEENIGITIDELPDPIPQSLCTSEASSGLASKPVQPRAASVEVDILKNSSPRASGSKVNVPELDTIGNSASNSEVQKDYMGKTVCLEQQRGCVGDLTKQEPQKDTEIMQNQDELLLNLQIKGDLGLPSENTEVVTPVCPKRQSSEEETFVDPKQFQSPQNNSDATLLLRKKTDNSRAVDSQDTSEVVLQCDLTKGSDFKVADKESSALASFAQNSFFSAEESENVLNKFQSLKLDSKRESRSVSKFDTCVERHGVQYKHAKNDAFYHKLTSLSADDKKLSEPQSREESSSSSGSENEDTCSDLESDDDDGDELKQWLPSVDEFERDFEEYLRNVSSADHQVQNAPKSNDGEGNRLENVSNVDHLVKSSPSSSEVGHELDSGCTQCECKQPGGARRDGSYIKTAGASASTHQLDVSSDTCSHHKLHSGFDVHTRNTSCQGTFAESCMSRQHLDTFPGTYNEMVHHGEHWREHYFQHQYQTKRCCSGHNEKPLSVRKTSSYLYPNGYNDKWYECGNSCNYRDDDNYDRNYTADWSASGQRQAYSASSQQHLDQSYNSVGCYQDYQWNMSWYNAYQRQTSFIRQFVSFSRTWRF